MRNTKDITTTALLTEHDLRRRFGFALSTLRRWRRVGGGPPFFRLSARRVRYDQDAVETWLMGCQQSGGTGDK